MKFRIAVILCALSIGIGGCAEKTGKIKNQKVSKESPNKKADQATSKKNSKEKKDKAK